MYAVEDYAEAKGLSEREAEKLRRLALRDGRVFVSSGRLTEKFKPYVLPFLKRGNGIGDFLNIEKLG